MGPGEVSLISKAKKHKGIIKNKIAMDAITKSKNLFMNRLVIYYKS
jgi:hypothetical protein